MTTLTTKNLDAALAGITAAEQHKDYAAVIVWNYTKHCETIRAALELSRQILAAQKAGGKILLDEATHIGFHVVAGYPDLDKKDFENIFRSIHSATPCLLTAEAQNSKNLSDGGGDA